MRKARSRSKLSIIVPVFNEAVQIQNNLDMLLAEVEKYFTTFEVIVVSDGSTDGTNLALLSFTHPDMRSVILDRNTGKGNAVRAGFQAASGDYILFIDGGMEIHPKEIRIFMGLMNLYDCDIVIGSKRHPQSKVEYPWYRRVLSFAFQKLVRLLFHIDVTDTQVGIKLFRGEVIDAVLPHLEIDRYGFDLELLSMAKHFGFGDILEAPIKMEYFNKNQKSVGREFAHVVRVGLSLLSDTFRLYRRLKALPATPDAHASHERAS
ncbi:MAG: glycosyltransferase family 2 protein [Bdellovibrionales bacterium]|nr:glycosyltransferase family 2 protein [Bdellovibrionales bacterium]